MTTKTIVRFHRAAAAVLFVGLVAFGGGAAHAQQKVAPVIGIIDVDGLLQESLAAKGVRLEREKYATNYQTQLKDIETKLRAEDQELSQQRGILAQDVFQQRAQAFQQKLQEYQGQAKDKQDRLDYSFQQAMNQIGNTVLTVANEVSKTQGINMVFARNQVMVFDPTMDITKSVLEKLNQRLPTVVFQDPATLQLQAQAPGAPGAAPIAGAKAPVPAPAKK